MGSYSSCTLYNKTFPTLLVFDFKKLQIIYKPSHMKCFQTIFSNRYLATGPIFFPITFLLARLGLMFTCRKNKLFCVEFLSLPFNSWFESFINCYIPSYMPQCLLVPHLAPLLQFWPHHASSSCSILWYPHQSRWKTWQVTRLNAPLSSS